jgi:inosine-uridine nucleoside N-ribohydrolase
MLCASTSSSTPGTTASTGRSSTIHWPSEPLYVDVETGGGIADGMTVADRRHLTGKPPNVDVATSADVVTFMERLIERVGGLAADHPNVSR